LEGDRPGVRARIDVGDEASEIWYRVSEGPIAQGSETFLAATLPSAMKLGFDLELPGGISPRLLHALPTIQTILRSWVPECREIPVHPGAPRAATPIPGRGVACFFSGGVDSFYTLLKHREEIDRIVLVHGFDLRLDDAVMRTKVSEAMREVAAEIGVGLIEVETNVRSMADRYFPWRFYHGAMLASVALLLAPQIRKFYVAASDSFATLMPWGSHPLLDPLWSTEQTELIHDGLEATRLEKVASIASSEIAMRYLRVCFPWTNDAGGYNCGRCEKCLTTMACLRGVGALGLCATFPPELDLSAFSRLLPVDDAYHLEVKEILRGLEQSGRDPLLAGALRGWLDRRDPTGIAGIPLRAYRRVRRMAGRFQKYLPRV